LGPIPVGELSSPVFLIVLRSGHWKPLVAAPT